MEEVKNVPEPDVPPMRLNRAQRRRLAKLNPRPRVTWREQQKRDAIRRITETRENTLLEECRQEIEAEVKSV